MKVTGSIDVSLLRHGEAEGGARYRGITDDVLTVSGWAQMWAAVSDDHGWNRIVSSPLARCAEFAGQLARRHSIPLRIDDRLREMDFGAWDGRTAAEIMQTDADALARFWQDPWNHEPTGGETLMQMHKRVLKAWQDVVAERRSTLMVTHAGPIRIILCHVRGLPVDRLLDIEVPLASLHRMYLPVPESTTMETQSS